VRSRRRITIQDITLREGQQAADVALALDEKRELAERLVAAGITRIQAGYAGSDDQTVRALKGIPDLQASALLVAFRDDWRTAAASVAAAGVDVIMVLYRIAPSQLAAMGISQRDALARIRESVALSKELVPTVSFDPSFVTMAEPAFLEAAYTTAAEADSDHFGIADSTGVATPERIGELVKLVRRVTGGGSVGVHCHTTTLGSPWPTHWRASPRGLSLPTLRFSALANGPGTAASKSWRSRWRSFTGSTRVSAWTR